MNQSERRIFLIKELLNERHMEADIPAGSDEQRRLLRSLMNVRDPYEISDDFLKVQDEYLKEEILRKGVTDCETLAGSKADERLILWQGDITTLKADAIVNAANSALLGCFVPCHSCVDNIIHSVSGIRLRLACHRIMKEQGHDEPTGQAKITPAFNLPCSYVIHTVGPIIYGEVKEHDKELLSGCYSSCLKLADEKNLKSIAFCCISTGEFHFPNALAARIAVKTVTDYLDRGSGIERVIFNVFKDVDREIYEELLGGVRLA